MMVVKSCGAGAGGGVGGGHRRCDAGVELWNLSLLHQRQDSQ